MIRPMTYPPYSLKGEGDEAWIVDSHDNDVVLSVTMPLLYGDAFPDMMAILCDALNRSERKEGA